jgi:uncharacterized protein (TIGR02466 family)
MRKIVNIFPVTILDATLDGSDDINKMLIPKLYELFDTTDSKRMLSHNWKDFVLTNERSRSGYSSFNDSDLAVDPNFKFFFDKLSTLVAEFLAQLGYTGKWKFENSWSNIYPADAFVPLHDHRGLHWSGVYYVQAEERCGDLILVDPKEYALANEPENTMYRGNNDFRVEPTPGKVLIFPGYLKHETAPNKSNNDRIIISFNIKCYE